MKIGVCGSARSAEFAKRIGFDYMEENLSVLAESDEAAFAETVRFYEKLDFPIYSFNGMLSGSLSLYEGDLADVRTYAEKAMSRAKALGGSLCVLGSGKARHIPDHLDKAFCHRRFCEVATICAEEADRCGLRMVIEPLRRGETNYIHTVSEAYEVALETARPNVGALVDFFHFFENGEADDGLHRAKDLLWHAHIARPVNRFGPTVADTPQLLIWKSMLDEVGYTGRISLECRWSEQKEQDMIRAYEAMAPFRS